MKVIKKNGSVYELNVDKIKTSIVNSASDINMILTNSDIKLLINEILCVLNRIRRSEGTCMTSVYELRGIVYCVLIDHGFKKIAMSYMNNAFRK